MQYRDHFHCPTCGAKFDMEIELKHHERLGHAQRGGASAGVVPSNAYPPAVENDRSARKNKEFTRRHVE